MLTETDAFRMAQSATDFMILLEDLMRFYTMWVLFSEEGICRLSNGDGDTLDLDFFPAAHSQLCEVHFSMKVSLKTRMALGALLSEAFDHALNGQSQYEDGK